MHGGFAGLKPPHDGGFLVAALARAGKRSFDLGLRDGDDAVGVGNDQIAGRDGDIGDHNRLADRRRMQLDGRAHGDAAREHRKFALFKRRQIAHAAIDHQPCNAARLRRDGQDLAPVAGDIAVAIDHQHVAGSACATAR